MKNMPAEIGQPADGDAREEELRLLRLRVNQLEALLAQPRLTGQPLEGIQDPFRQLVENAREGICVVRDGRVCYANQAALRICGMDFDELTSQSFVDYLHPDDRAMAARRLAPDPFDEHLPGDVRARFMAPGGVPRWLMMAGVPVSWQGAPAAMCTFCDITKQMVYEDHLRRDAGEWLRIVHSIPVPVFVLDSRHRVIHWNRACQALTGVSEAEVLRTQRHAEVLYNKQRKVLADLIVDGAGHREIRDLYGIHCRPSKLIKGGYYAEDFFPNLGGEGKWLAFVAAPLHDSAGNTVGAIETVYDITELRMTLGALKESELRYRTLFEQIDDAIVVTRNNRVVDMNPRALALFGCKAEQLLGKTPEELSAPIQACGHAAGEAGRKYKKEVAEGRSCRFEWLHRRFDGEAFPSEVLLSPLPLPGQDTMTYAIIRDTTERISAEQEMRALEEQLRHSQKMESLGTLAGGIAHDFNNILGAVMGYTEMAIRRVSQGRDNTNELEQVLDASERAKALVRQILTFGRKLPSQPRLLDLGAEVARGAKLLGSLIPKMIEVDLELGPWRLSVEADAVQLEQVLLNLCVNAADAMPDGGVLTIGTRREVMDGSDGPLPPDMRPGPYAVLSVSDNGAGMDEKTLQQIFDPFFTTKEVGRGTGLGLSTVYGIVQGHGGLVRCQSQPGVGSTFEVCLPLREGASPAEPAAGKLPNRHGAGGDELVMLVDDEASMLGVVRGSLESAGYRVLTATSGEEAVDLFREAGGAVDLVVLDVGMPGMGGGGCLDSLRAVKPGLRVLVVSGYSVEGALDGMLGRRPDGFLPKPFRIGELLAQVRHILDTPRRP